MPEAPTLPRFCGAGYVARLQCHGFQVIGTGGGFSFPATYVLAKPGSDAVVKVGSFPAGDPWPLFAAWSIENPGPLQPAVRSLRWHGEGLSRFFVATMSRLYPVDWRQHRPFIEALSDWYEWCIREGIDYREWHDGPIDPRLSSWLADRMEAAGLTDTADHLRRLRAAFPDFTLDPQPVNWMGDGAGRLVLIDPFARIRGNVAETAPRIVANEGPRYASP